MAFSKLYPAIRMIRTAKRGLHAQPLPYVCKRCLATLTEDRKPDIPVQSISEGAESTSEKNQSSDSVNISSNLHSQTPNLGKSARITSRPRRRRYAFTKKYPKEVSSPQEARIQKAREMHFRHLLIRLSKSTDSIVDISKNSPEDTSLTKFISAYVNKLLKKLYAREKSLIQPESTTSASKQSSGKGPARKRKPAIPIELATKLSDNVKVKGNKVTSPNDEPSGLKLPDGTISISGRGLFAIRTEQEKVPKLSYGLDRVLFNPGVYYLQDPRSRIYNFDPYLEKIMPISEFDFSLLKEYITSSKDETLSSMAKEHKSKYAGSSSSMTGLLSQFHFLLSNWRPINFSMLSKDFPVSSTKFTKWCKAPSAVFLRYKDGAYAIDSDNTLQSSNVLMLLGKSMEKLLTLTPDRYERYRKNNDNPVTHDEREKPEVYNYTSFGDILMRSQLDAHDPRLPGSGLFDLKSRAVVSIRMELDNHERGSGYEIRHDQGQWESFEREYHDMVRATLLKYALQVRVGRMDGIFVAYHNVERIFGFQYISLEEMDLALHGQKNTILGNQEFELSLKLLNEVLDRIIERFPKQSCRLLFEAKENSSSLNIYAVPVDDDEIQSSIKSAGNQVQQLKRTIYGSTESLPEAISEDLPEQNNIDHASQYFERPNNLIGEQPEQKPNVPLKHVDNSTETGVSNAEKDLVSKEEQYSINPDNRSLSPDSEKSNEIQDIGEAGEIIEPTPVSYESAPEESSQSFEDGKEIGESSDGKFPMIGKRIRTEASEVQNNGSTSEKEEAEQPIFLLQLHVANKVNDIYVARPEQLAPADKWDLEYRIDEVKETFKALKMYSDCLKSRGKLFEETKNVEWKKSSVYIENLRRLSDKGRHWRQEQNVVDEAVGQVVYKSSDSATLQS